MKSTKEVRIHDLLVVSHNPEATLWRVVSVINRFRVEVVDAQLEESHPNIASREHDINIFYRPNKAQLDSFVNRVK